MIRNRHQDGASEVVALVMVGGVGGGQESPIFEFLPFARLFQMEITAAVGRKEGGRRRRRRRRARVWMASMPWGSREEGGAISGFLSAPRANFELEIVQADILTNRVTDREVPRGGKELTYSDQSLQPHRLSLSLSQLPRMPRLECPFIRRRGDTEGDITNDFIPVRHKGDPL